MTTELLRLCYLSISCTEDQCAFSGAVISTEMEVSIEKKKDIFEKTTIIIFNLFVIEKGKSQYKGSIPYFQAFTSERSTC